MEITYVTLHLYAFCTYFFICKKSFFQVLARGVLRNEYYNPTYRVLGWLTLLHLIVSVVQLVQQSIQVSEQIGKHPSLYTAVIS